MGWRARAISPALGALMQPPLVEANGLSKSYRLWPQPADRLTAAVLSRGARARWLPGAWRRRLAAGAERRGRIFHALRDVGFTLPRGESLGIIGRNGSGKSTLLQILAGTLRPTAGTVTVRGKLAALLELGSGFNPEFSGRENVLLQAALHGLSRREAEEHFAEVEEFAGIGEFIEQPVKVYSSGMMVRLAFATQTVMRPELLIVDEALAVGDVFFQARCGRYFQERVAAGMSLILVSHDLPSVKAFCRQTLVLHEGRLAFAGPSEAAVARYHELHRGTITAPRPAGPIAPPSGEAGEPLALPAGARERNWPAAHEAGSREAELLHCRMTNARGEEAELFAPDDEVRLEFYARSRVRLENLVACLELSNRHNQVVHGVTSAHLGAGFHAMEEGRLHCFTFSFPARLGPGDYLVDAALGWGDRGDGAPEQLVHRVGRIAAFKVHHPGPRPAFFGPAPLDAQLRWR